VKAEIGWQTRELEEEKVMKADFECQTRATSP